MIELAERCEVNFISFGNTVKRIASCYDVVFCLRQPDNLTNPQRIRRSQSINLNNLAHRHIVSARNAIKRVAFFYPDR